MLKLLSWMFQNYKPQFTPNFFQPLPATSTIFQLLPIFSISFTISNNFQPAPTTSTIFQQLPPFSKQFQQLPTSSTIFQPLPATSTIFQLLPSFSKHPQKIFPKEPSAPCALLSAPCALLPALCSLRPAPCSFQFYRNHQYLPTYPLQITGISL